MSGGTAIIGVAELHRRLKNAVHAACGFEWVEGEIASLKRAPSGHAYFQLKDEREDAVLDCVMYKFYAARARRFLNEGARVQLSGRATIYAARGRLQYVAEGLRPAGRGALLEALEQLKQRLAAEGLFDSARKRALPRDPRVVGVVTSRSGAALHDITSVAFRRANVTVVLSAALVQGEEAPRSLVRALDKIERFPGLEVVIIGRGGGSAEDLMAFNDERVVRRVASMQVPVVSAVGHEVDISLTDFAADVRAATPSQAAELVVPDRRSRARALDDQLRHLGRAMRTRLIEAHAEVERFKTRIGDPRFYLAEKQQQLDDARLDLERSFARRMRDRRQRMERLHRRVLQQHPTAVLSRARTAILPLNARLLGAMRMRLSGSRALLGERLTRIEALSPLAVLGRGYAIARDLEGKVVTDAALLSDGQRVTVRLRQGQFLAAVEERQLEKERHGS